MMTESNDDHEFENTDEMSFAELFESYDTTISNELNQGDMVEGEIISIGSKNVYVDTGTKSDGVAIKSELLDENDEFLCFFGTTYQLSFVFGFSEEVFFVV